MATVYCEKQHFFIKHVFFRCYWTLKFSHHLQFRAFSGRFFSDVTYSNSCIDLYTDGGSGCHAGCRPAHQEELGVQYLAQGHCHM